MKRILTVIIVFLAISAKAQTFKKSDFNHTQWFTDNKENAFSNSDTVRFIKRSKKGPEWAKTDYAESEVKYLNHGDYLNFNFNKDEKLEYWETYNNYKNVTPLQEFKWKFNRKRNSILILKKEVLMYELKPISKRQIKIDSRFSENNNQLITEEVTLIKLK